MFALVLFYLASVHVSSCTNTPLKAGSPLKTPIIRVLNDSGGTHTGIGTGSLPKTIKVRCINQNCALLDSDTSSVPPGSLKLDVVYTDNDSIPAHTILKLVVFQSQDSIFTSKSGKAK